MTKQQKFAEIANEFFKVTNDASGSTLERNVREFTALKRAMMLTLDVLSSDDGEATKQGKKST